MTTHVVATAGHVDHGKSTLVRALTGMEPDRWTEERRRGLTIDLGFVWTTLPSGREVAFVDVPGHERFVANMLAGVGPVGVVCFVVAADEGWSVQSTDHRDALAALGIEHGVIVVTRADRAPERVEEVMARARDEFAETGLADAPIVAVSAVTGEGMDELRRTLDAVLGALPSPPTDERVRLWLDRSFSITGAGTVVTGTLTAGTLRRGDRLTVVGPRGSATTVQIRGQESRRVAAAELLPVDRVALNLRGVATDEVGRGDALVTPGAWPDTQVLDVRRFTGEPLDEVPAHVVVHVGTAAIPARLRSFDPTHARLTLERPAPLVAGDRLLLRAPGGHAVLGGVGVLDPEPPRLRRRGDGARRAAILAAMPPGGDVLPKLAREGAVEIAHMRRLGLVAAGESAPDGIQSIDGWWVEPVAYDGWRVQVAELIKQHHARDPLSAGLSQETLRAELGMPASQFLSRLIADAGLTSRGAHVSLPGAGDDLGAAEAGLALLEQRLAAEPFRAPEADDLAAWQLGVREVAAAERLGRLIRLTGGVVLLPSAPALAMRELARLRQPFTTSEARQALGTSRRVAIPLLEHLDARGWTRRVDEGHREVT